MPQAPPPSPPAHPASPPPLSPSSALAFIHDVTSRADLVQSEVLHSILHRNSDTEYLRRVVGLDSNASSMLHQREPLVNAYKRLAPLVTYEDLEPLIRRIANGDKSPILSSHPISEFLTSSGTSAGERKLMPTIEDEWERRSLLYSLLMPVMSQYMDGLEDGKGLYFLFVKAETRTPSGLVARPVLTSYYNSDWFRRQAEVASNQYTSPVETILCPDSTESMYCQLLCGLVQRHHVVRIGAVFASGFLRAISFLQKRWPELVADMGSAALCGSAVTDPAARRAVEELMLKYGGGGGGGGGAEEVAAECRNPSWHGIIRRLWPRAKYIDVIVTGSMAQYIPTLDYYSDGLPLVSTMYASSECYFGINLTPLAPPSAVTYTLLPNMAYFEFLPAGGNENQEPKVHDLIDLVDVEIGKEYELVITTYTGLCRYRVGDVLRVTGFHNKAPQFQFVCRKNVVLSIDSDKTDEETLMRAIKVVTTKHLAKAKWRLVEYTSYADLNSIPGHYVLFWELSKVDKEENINGANVMDTHEMSSLLEDCCLAIEDCLDSVYRQGRVSDKSIGPLELRVVATGTFDALMDYCLASGSSINQYKTPRCVKHPPIVELLNSHVTHHFFSPKLPFWAPGQRAT